VPKDGHARSADQPQDGGDGARPDAERHGDNEQAGVELGGGGAEDANVEVSTLELRDREHAADDEDNDEEEQEVGEEGVDAEHNEDDRVVAAEVGEVVVDPVLDFGEVAGLGEGLDVQEFRERLEVGEAIGPGLRAHAVEARLQVQPACERVKGDVDTRHDDDAGWAERRKARRGRRRSMADCDEKRRSTEFGAGAAGRHKTPAGKRVEDDGPRMAAAYLRRSKSSEANEANERREEDRVRRSGVRMCWRWRVEEKKKGGIRRPLRA